MSKFCNKIQHKSFWGNTYSNNIKINILYKTLEGILRAKIANIIFFLSFLCIKGLNIKMNLISAEGYKNPGVSHLIIKETDKLWISMKDVEVGLGVKSLSDLVLKEIHGICGKKN